MYWPHEKGLQDAVLRILESAEHGLGRHDFSAQNLRVTNETTSDGHVTVGSEARTLRKMFSAALHLVHSIVLANTFHSGYH